MLIDFYYERVCTEIEFKDASTKCFTQDIYNYPKGFMYYFCFLLTYLYSFPLTCT